MYQPTERDVAWAKQAIELKEIRFPAAGLILRHGQQNELLLFSDLWTQQQLETYYLFEAVFGAIDYTVRIGDETDVTYSDNQSRDKRPKGAGKSSKAQRA